jgi:catechol 2,3-dioxygenase-like lactoylglutathione lyase family enzyme
MSPMTTTITPTLVSTAPLYVVLPAENLERARRFYEGELGVELKEAPGGLMGMTGSGTGLFIYQAARTKAEHTAATFVVPSVVEAVAQLRSHGVVFEEYDLPGLKTVEGIAEMEGVKSAWFKDSEGNIIAVNEM